ncbi:hypothetical protein AS9A_3280 [Hoyosella subflava DQS3-9A1]|uniref:HEAT repeat domain-containing protein n=1 Tax=Hoyosella subflava (strain DSM 45089 / JCM 17490 / NBRC 109087 / DQS3-9A1) TaxID=443218 RepID=F6EP62_HOYSD|nr:hypothetical protein AS9A_3280 [Hoyosella subflava DQS3-9A1]
MVGQLRQLVVEVVDLALLFGSRGIAAAQDTVEIGAVRIGRPTREDFTIEALGQMKAPGARTVIESYLDDPDPYTRKQATRALAKLAD